MTLTYKKLLILSIFSLFALPSWSMEDEREINQPAPSLPTLPQELKEEIFEYVSVNDLNSLSLSCKDLHESVEAEAYWKRRGKRVHGEQYINLINEPGNTKTNKDHFVNFRETMFWKVRPGMHKLSTACNAIRIVPLQRSLNLYRKNHAVTPQDHQAEPQKF